MSTVDDAPRGFFSRLFSWNIESAKVTGIALALLGGSLAISRQAQNMRLWAVRMKTPFLFSAGTAVTGTGIYYVHGLYQKYQSGREARKSLFSGPVGNNEHQNKVDHLKTWSHEKIEQLKKQEEKLHQKVDEGIDAGKKWFTSRTDGSHTDDSEGSHTNITNGP